MESLSLSSGLALLFGALHALEPGHGKTALLTYIASGKRSWKEGMVISVSSAVTHSLAVFFIAFISHHLVHHGTVGFKVEYIGGILSAASGSLICGLGLWIIYKGRKGEATYSCTSCAMHKHDHHNHDGHHHHHHEHQHGSNSKKAISKSGFLTSGILGVATGIIPCPSVVVAYLSGVSAGNSFLGMQNVLLFALGMCGSLMGVIVFCSMGGEKLLNRFKNKKSRFNLNWSYIQGGIFVLIGVGTALYH